MSGERRRPTREATRTQLRRAAETVFMRQGIGGSSIEDVCAEAGLTRGALYSNFADKDELVLAVMADHDQRNLTAMEQLFAAAVDNAGFLEAFAAHESERARANGRWPILQIEFVLYAARNPANRELLAERRRRWRELITAIVEADFADVARRTAAGGSTAGRSTLGDPPMAVSAAVDLIVALDDGYVLGEIIEPGSYRPGTVSRNLLALRAMWLGPAAPPGRSGATPDVSSGTGASPVSRGRRQRRSSGR